MWLNGMVGNKAVEIWVRIGYKLELMCGVLERMD